MRLFCIFNTTVNPHRDFRICHLNIQSIKNNREKFQQIELQLANVYDIITMSETWLTPDTLSDNFKLLGYHPIYRRDRINGVGGGVAAWISNSMIATRKAEYENPLIEALWLEIRIHNNKFYFVSFTDRPRPLPHSGMYYRIC